MAIEKIPENWYIGGPTYPSSFTKDKITLIQTVNYLTGKVQECIETINAVDPEQVNEFISLVNQLNEAVTQLTSEVNTATETANNASQTATSAKQTADGLAGEIAQANTTANEAKSTADSAIETAQGASSKADNAVTVAGEANGKSDNAIQVANATTTSANEAKVAAQAAQNSATSALGNASTALSTANQALTKSETAISSAETANNTANSAKTTAEGIASTANSAVNTANEAKSTADAASAKVDSFVHGHTIVNSFGGNMPSRNKLQFKGATVSDNYGNDTTIVEIPSGTINNETNMGFEDGQIIMQKNNKATGKNLIDLIYPIGSIFEWSNDNITTEIDFTTPDKVSSYFGGRWEKYGEGRVTVAISPTENFSTAGKIGGEETHTLTVTEMPAHTHPVQVCSESGTTGNYYVADHKTNKTSPSTTNNYAESVGGGEAHNNLQPYIVIYRYRRIG